MPPVAALGDMRTTLPTSPPTTLSALLDRLEAEESAAAMHGRRVALLAARAGCAAGLTPPELRELVLAAKLHEVGRLVVPGGHPVVAHDLLREVPGLEEVSLIVRWGQERHDGGGGPDGLVGPEIPRESALLAVCDAWDAMLAPLSERQPMTVAEADAEVGSRSGTRFAPDAVEGFFRSRARTRVLAEVALSA